MFYWGIKGESNVYYFAVFLATWLFWPGITIYGIITSSFGEKYGFNLPVLNYGSSSFIKSSISFWIRIKAIFSLFLLPEAWTFEYYLHNPYKAYFVHSFISKNGGVTSCYLVLHSVPSPPLTIIQHVLQILGFASLIFKFVVDLRNLNSCKSLFTFSSFWSTYKVELWAFNFGLDLAICGDAFWGDWESD